MMLQTPLIQCHHLAQGCLWGHAQGQWGPQNKWLSLHARQQAGGALLPDDLVAHAGGGVGRRLVLLQVRAVQQLRKNLVRMQAYITLRSQESSPCPG